MIIKVLVLINFKTFRCRNSCHYVRDGGCQVSVEKGVHNIYSALPVNFFSRPSWTDCGGFMDISGISPPISCPPGQTRDRYDL